MSNDDNIEYSKPGPKHQNEFKEDEDGNTRIRTPFKQKRGHKTRSRREYIISTQKRP